MWSRASLCALENTQVDLVKFHVALAPLTVGYVRRTCTEISRAARGRRPDSVARACMLGARVFNWGNRPSLALSFRFLFAFVGMRGVRDIVVANNTSRIAYAQDEGEIRLPQAAATCED